MSRPEYGTIEPQDFLVIGMFRTGRNRIMSPAGRLAGRKLVCLTPADRPDEASDSAPNRRGTSDGRNGRARDRWFRAMAEQNRSLETQFRGVVARNGSS